MLLNYIILFFILFIMFFYIKKKFIDFNCDEMKIKDMVMMVYFILFIFFYN